jgi:ribonuclease HII
MTQKAKQKTVQIPAQKSTPKRHQSKWLVGIDEVGRGPLAGPVGVGMCFIPFVKNISNSYKEFLKKNKENLKKNKLSYVCGKDSKKLSTEMREIWSQFFNDAVLGASANFIYMSKTAKQIDENGISVCIKSCISDGLQKHMRDTGSAESEYCILLDGGLKAPVGFENQETFTKGDEKEMVISFASIYAKVKRDLYMTKCASKPEYGKYGFEKHKGYGTESHRCHISQHGLSDLHRESYCRNIRKSI